MAEVVIDPKFHKPESQPVAAETYYELTYNPKTGDSKLYQYNVIGGKRGEKFEVWLNGVWKFNPGAVTTRTEKIEVHDKAKEKIKEVVKKDPSKNIVPGFVQNDAESQDIDRSGNAVPTESSGGLIGNLFSSIGSVLDLNDFGTKTIKDLFPNLLKYPQDIIENQQDILKISQYQYEAPYRDIFEGIEQGSDEVNEPLGILKNGIQRQSALKKFIQSVILPIPNNIADANGVNWGNGENLSSTNMMMSGNVDKVLGAAGLSGIASMAAGAVKNPQLAQALGTLGTKDAAQAMAMLFLGGPGALNTPATKAALSSLILKRANLDIPPETILSRGYGVVANSNLELLFSGPTIRGFQFGYIMSPRSQKEAEMCRNIIRFFKQGMAAKKSNKLDGFGASSFLLGTPNVFKLEYMTSGGFNADGKTKTMKSIKGLNKFKICALTNFNVSYADGQWAAYDEGQPIRYQFTLSFKELEPIYESDYQENPSNRLKPSSKDDKGMSYEDQPRVLPDEIGF